MAIGDFVIPSFGVSQRKRMMMGLEWRYPSRKSMKVLSSATGALKEKAKRLP